MHRFNSGLLKSAYDFALNYFKPGLERVCRACYTEITQYPDCIQGALPPFTDSSRQRLCMRDCNTLANSRSDAAPASGTAAVEARSYHLRKVARGSHSRRVPHPRDSVPVRSHCDAFAKDFLPPLFPH
jgi:hypothetical protein